MHNLLSPLTIKTGNQWADFNINSLILSLIIILIPIIIAFIIPLFERKKQKIRSTLYLYAFTIGFFVVLGLFGEISEGKELAVDAANHIDQNNFWLSFGYQILVLVIGGIIGLFGALGFKYLVNKKLGKYNSNFPIEKHSEHPAFHNHPHAHDLLINRNKNDTKSKTTALYLVLSHRFAAGLFLGYIINQIVSNNYTTTQNSIVETIINNSYNLNLKHGAVSNEGGINLAFFIGFFLHLIPEEAIIYYRQREMGIKRSKSILNSILMILILVPFIFLGANIGTFVSDLWWLNGIIHVIVGVLFVFTALVEFFPEVIQEAKTQKKWYLTITWMIIGIIVCFILVSFGG
ncbi:hypothetical protein [Mycoplasmoides pirum]|uniref:hypothetical protein n=1 Tax=Mycoplasmoides pirum TaxID=2122 RepID=UPI0004874BD7|nr:hypothetical protein [Mycoplasmoides pirum]